jgi:hypothetical protein
MMLIGRSSRRENLLIVTGVEPMKVIRTHLANHIRASSREEWLHQQARHMTAPDRNHHHANSALDAGAPSTHDNADADPPVRRGMQHERGSNRHAHSLDPPG